jgi:L-ascorbate metabolism protein UlaG (beta-lactamase superfamily)
MWHAEAAGLRLLFDPLLGPTHHDGVFTVTPPRAVDVAALRPDVVVVSHRHPDHFDVGSLHILARRYPDAVVLTADALVGRTCQRLGFRHVSLLPDHQALDLGGVQLLTTASHCKVDEWGVVLATGDGTVWNQIDTVLGTPDMVKAALSQAADALHIPALADGPDLAMVRWQPLLQVGAALGNAPAFPHAHWAAEVQRIRATNPGHAILGASGGAYVGHSAWQNAREGPVSPERARRDLRALGFAAPVDPLSTGTTWTLRGGEVSVDPAGGRDLVEVTGPPISRAFAPGALPAVTDPDPRGLAALTPLVDAWIRGPLAEAVARALPAAGVPTAALQLDAVACDDTATWTLSLSNGTVTVTEGAHPDPDMVNTIAMGDLHDVLEGRAHWGRPLLGGRLRTVDRLVAARDGALTRPRLPPFFLYLALPYDTATERWIEHQLRALGC